MIRLSLITSLLGHVSILMFIIANGFLLQNEIEESLPPVQISVISVHELDAKLSEAPSSILTQIPATIAHDEPGSENVPRLIQEEPPEISGKTSSLSLKLEDFEFKNNEEMTDLEIIIEQNIILKAPSSTDRNESIAFKESQGNEKITISKPKLVKPRPRTADRIDKVAASESDSAKILEINKEAVKASDDAMKIEAITNSESPKAASSEITPEGEKNVEIVPTEVVLKSAPPPSRPNLAQVVDKPLEKPKPLESIAKPVKRPSSSELLKKSKEKNQYDQLVAQLEEEKDDEVIIVSAIEKRNMKSAIKQKLAKYWDIGSLAGNSNFEKYVVKVEVKVNEVGEILVGRIKPLSPVVLEGRYAIAFRHATNALISAKVLPIIPGKYPNGITFEINFNPETGFSF